MVSGEQYKSRACMQINVAYPKDLDDVDATWLSAALSGTFPGIQVASARRTTVINGMATKARFELSYDSEGNRGSGPASLWVKAGFEAHSGSQPGAFANEVNFFRDIAPRLPISCPRSYFQTLSPDKRNGLILLEDLTSRKVRFGDVATGVDVDTAAAVLDLQAKYHAHFWNKAELEAIPWLSTGGSIVDDGVVDIFLGFWDDTEGLPRFQFVTENLRDRSRIRRALQSMWELAAKSANCLVHGDTHASNLYFDLSGAPGYLDWQQIMRGAWGHDVANFLVTGLAVEDRRRQERELIAHYIDRLAAYGAAAPSFDDAWLTYRRHAAWTFLWTLCPPSFHPEQTCVAVSKRVCAALNDLESMESLGH